MIRIVCLALMLAATSSSAQDWRGFTLGAELPADPSPPGAVILSPPSPLPDGQTSAFMHPYPARDGLSVVAMTHFETIKVMALTVEAASTNAQIGPFTFGRTTLADITAHFGSGGLQPAMTDGPQLQASYEIGDTGAMLTLYFVRHEAGRPRTLASVLLADANIHAFLNRGLTLRPTPSYRALSESGLP